MSGRIVRVERDRSPSERILGSRLPWTTRCDGMPSLFGCGSEIETTRPYVRPGKKSTGWLLTWALDDDGSEDRTLLLAFCPRCAAIVEGQTS